MNGHMDIADSCCIIVPAYREAGRIAPVVRSILGYCPHVVVIDDGSDDATAEEAGEAGAEVIRHAQNRGKGAALHTGLQYARERGYRLMITMDADGQHDPAAIPHFLSAHSETGCRVLTGNRMASTEIMPLIRRWTNQFMSWLLSREMKQHVTLDLEVTRKLGL